MNDKTSFIGTKQRILLPMDIVNRMMELGKNGVKFEFPRYEDRFQVVITHDGSNLSDEDLLVFKTWCYQIRTPLTIRRMVG